MSGYRLMELTQTQPYKPRGILLAGEAIGILDFLREIEGEPCPFPRMSSWQIIGLDELLFAARPRETEITREIHRRLNQAASDFDRRMLDLQVIFSGKFVRGADMSVDYRAVALPIHLIFNHPPPQQDSDGNVFYRMEFHLSSP